MKLGSPRLSRLVTEGLLEEQSGPDQPLALQYFRSIK